ncbi:MAG TPA: vitamin B12-dependent ribonucleotide reductase, partial [Candidatus Paceibacterota bacterium]
GRINASNPCSEYMHLDNTSCNLASLNLMKFEDNGFFDINGFIAAINVIITAMDISVSFGDFPTEQIGANTRRFRQLGLGYANLGALLMSRGLPYDSDEGRELAASITSLMSGAAYRRSAELAELLGPYGGYSGNKYAHRRVVSMHHSAGSDLTGEIANAAEYQWCYALEHGDIYGYRNSQISVLAPTGTIGLMMDCDTTGIEPAIALTATKKLVGGGSMVLTIDAVEQGLKTLYLDQVLDYLKEHGTLDGSGIQLRHRKVFQTAIGDDPISPMGHIKMMAAVQPFLSGAISKTVNLPHSATVEDVEEIYMKSWEMGLKAVAIYRDNCKVGQPLSASKKTEVAEPVAVSKAEQANTSHRRKLPKKRQGSTQSFKVAGAGGFLTSSSYPDGGLGEIFLKMSKQGSTLAGVFDALSIAVSIALQHGVPLETFVKKFTNMRFEPAGFTDDPDIRMTSSILDYVFRRLALDYLPEDVRRDMGILSASERTAEVEGNTEAEVVDNLRTTVENSSSGSDAPMCFTCGIKMRRAGSCHVCDSCGSTSGCS